MSRAKWDLWYSSASPLVRAALTKGPSPAAQDESRIEYVDCAGRLPGPACEALSRGAVAPAAGADPEYRGVSWRYLLFECGDGEAPIFHTFKDPKLVASYVAKLAGKDVYVWAAYGVPIPITAGPRRMLLLPNGKGVTVPALPGDKPKVRRLGFDPPVQADGFLGPPDLDTSDFTGPAAGPADEFSEDD